jgi:GxxExxY protein
MPEEKILYRELSYKLVGCFYEVYNRLGPGHKEDIYQKALVKEFKLQNIPIENKKRLKIDYKGEAVGIYEPDFIIADKIIVELKSVLAMPKVYEKQLFYYLRGAGYKLGYLVNFGSDKIDIRRRIV